MAGSSGVREGGGGTYLAQRPAELPHLTFRQVELLVEEVNVALEVAALYVEAYVTRQRRAPQEYIR